MANLVQVKAMCKAMAKYGMDVTLSLQANSKKNGKYIENNNFTIQLRRPLIENKKLDKYINFHSVIHTIKNNIPDIIFLRSPLLLKQAINSKIPVIIELHNYQLHQGYKLLDKYWHSFLIKAANTDQVLKIVCISDALSSYWIKQGIPSGKIITLHDGIDPDEYKKILTQKEARIKLNLPLEKKIVTYTGRLYKNRKIENIIKLAEKNNDVQFLVVGGPEKQNWFYKNLAKTKGINNIIFTGQVDHKKVSDYLFASDILLGLWSSEVKTINYCSPLKVFEYMAAERIIVAHAFPTIKEVLQHRYNALLVKPESYDDLEKKTKIALEINYPNKMAEQAKKEVYNNYTWDIRVSSIFEGIYN